MIKLTPELVSKVRKSARGKKYSALTYEEHSVLFGDSANAVDTVCVHNGIINDSGIPCMGAAVMRPEPPPPKSVPKVVK